MTSNLGAALSTASAAGAGLVVAPSFVTRPELVAGRLEPVLPDWKILPELGVYAIYPHRRFLAPKVKVFLESLRATYGDGRRDPWWVETEPKSRRRASTAEFG
jgi:DNA-binding transcriptional LysR family regulator